MPVTTLDSRTALAVIDPRKYPIARPFAAVIFPRPGETGATAGILARLGAQGR